MMDWQKATPDQFRDLIVGDRYLVAVPYQTQHDDGWHWDYDVIILTDDGFENSNGDHWFAWSWSDVEWFVHLNPSQPPFPTGNITTPTPRPK